ncbi:MAG: hypothetical protein JWQ66_273 [Mucilaginibacter sp.]|nr:hypothetical protein [Mucilaginibacter sp.]
MKSLLIIVLCFWVVGARSQSTGQVKELNVYGENGKSVIGKVITSTGAKTNLFLLHTIQKKDSANNYIITFYLGNKETTPLLNVRVLMKFSRRVIAVTPAFSAAFNSVNGLSDDHLTYVFKAGRLERDPGSVVIISFTIKSKERVVTEISGLDGIVR